MAKRKETIVTNKFVGSKGWLWFWVIVCFPVAIIYYLVKRAPVRQTVLRDNK